MKPLIYSLLTLIAFTMSPISQASLNGKNVVFVHGFQTSAIVDLDVRDDDLERERQGREQAGPEFGNIIEDYMYYDSAWRLSQNDNYLRTQLNRFVKSGVCKDGCFFITVSTGDLVTRYVMENLERWGIDRSRFWIIATFDLVGAGGGTELADVAATIVDGNPISIAARNLVNALGGPRFFLAGIGNDLRPIKARWTAIKNKPVGRFRIAGRGNLNSFNGINVPVGRITKPILLGGDDSIVPLHSACGSAIQMPIESCSIRREMGGDSVAFTSGPPILAHNHFPIVMAREMHHLDIGYKGIAVPVNTDGRVIINGQSFGIATQHSSRTTGHWWWRRTINNYQIQKNPNQTLVSFFINSFRGRPAVK